MRIILLFTIVLLAFGCKKSNDTSTNYWNVKYEVSGSGTTDGVYTDENANIQHISQLPFTYSAQWSKDPGKTIARNIRLALIGPTGNVVEKLYVDGKLVVQSTDANGALVYTLQN